MKHQIEYRYFKYFLAVAETLHFRKAAETLFISQPGLSRQIKQLEESLGAQLFERHNRKVELTSVGAYLQGELKTHFKHLDIILNHVKLLNEGIDGNLKFGYVGSAIQQTIPNLLLKLREIHPDILINLKEMDNEQQISALLNTDIDIGFVRQDRVPKDLNVRPMQEETFSLVLHENHLIDSSNFKNLSQLKNEQFILFDASYSQSYYEKVMQIFDDSKFIPVISHSTVNASSIYKLIENGFGVSIVPTSLKHGYNMKIKFIELVNIPQRTTLKMVWNSKNTNPVLQSFLGIF